MTWKQYRIIFRLKSPLHVGYRKVGNLMQTRRYVHGKVLWAALTARLTRDCSGRGFDGGAYIEIGAAIKKYFRFGYLWPALPRNNVNKVNGWNDVETFFSFDVDKKDLGDLEKLFPHPKKKNSTNKDQSRFDYLFLSSYAGAAQGHHNRGTEEGSLHDTEFIVPCARNGRQVYLTGSLWVAEKLPNILKGWDGKLRHLRLGGEESYGWGRVELIHCKSGGSIDPDGFSWSGPVPAHVNAIDSRDMVRGRIETLIGWATQIDGTQKVGPPIIVFAPGSYFPKFFMGDFGVWDVKN